MKLLEAFYLRHTASQFGIIEKNLLMVTQPHKCNQCQQCVQLTGMSFMLLYVFVEQKKVLLSKTCQLVIFLLENFYSNTFFQDLLKC